MQHALVVYSMGTQPFAHDRLRHAQLMQNLSLAQIVFGILISFADSTGLIFSLANSGALPQTNQTSIGLLSGLLMLVAGICCARSVKQSPSRFTLRSLAALAALNAVLNFACIVLFVLWSAVLGSVLRSAELRDRYSDRVQLVTVGLVANMFGALVSSAAICSSFGITYLFCENLWCHDRHPGTRSGSTSSGSGFKRWMPAPRPIYFSKTAADEYLHHSQLQLQLSDSSGV